MSDEQFLQLLGNRIPQGTRLGTVTPVWYDGWMESAVGGYTVYVPVLENPEHLVQISLSRNVEGDRVLIDAARRIWGGE